ncbi:mitochondrial carrier protein, putative [Trypanosoma cruzi]|nr:mitochondrial carrier protein, putative [Trypanosoma cruzi]PBJ70110.1 mitochondrial carrier protein [Trypanosoma cruzi cruzi]PWV01337.1 putative mitochondrial carrier protein [Trypanosoma cruzi]PWV17347.1 putative mitochondrial carrier protein [Trypanosoma cruzi]RNC56014.1 putative mitochondrial carrier protein [Trypanosoma cruzi]
MSTSSEKKHTPWVNAVAGGLGGAAAKSLLSPFQRVVVMQQLGEHKEYSTLQLARHIREQDGWKGFWKGNLTSMIIRVPYSGIQFVLYSQLKFFFQDICERYVRPRKGSAGDAHHRGETLELFLMKCGAGGISATIAGVAVYPGEVVRLRLMSGERQFNGIFNTIRCIYAETHSLRNFYRGLGASLMQRVPDILVSFAVYETMKYRLIEKDFLSSHPSYKNIVSTVAGGGAAALASILVAFPLDVAKRRIGMSGKGKSGVVYAGVRDCLRQVYAQEGIRGLYAGARVEAIRCVPQVVLMWFFIEGFQSFLTDHCVH